MVHSFIDTAMKKQSRLAKVAKTAADSALDTTNEVIKGLETSLGLFIGRLVLNANIQANTANHAELINKAYIPGGDWGKLLQTIFGRGLLVCANKQHALFVIARIPHYIQNQAFTHDSLKAKAIAFVGKHKSEEEALPLYNETQMKVFQLKQGIRHVLCQIMQLKSNAEHLAQHVESAELAIERSVEQIKRLSKEEDTSEISELKNQLANLVNSITLKKRPSAAEIYRTFENVQEKYVELSSDNNLAATSMNDVRSLGDNVAKIEKATDRIRCLEAVISRHTLQDTPTSRSRAGSLLSRAWSVVTFQGAAADASTDGPSTPKTPHETTPQIEFTEHAKSITSFFTGKETFNQEFPSDRRAKAEDILAVVAKLSKISLDKLAPHQKKQLSDFFVDTVSLLIYQMNPEAKGRKNRIQTFIEKTKLSFIWEHLAEQADQNSSNKDGLLNALSEVVGKKVDQAQTLGKVQRFLLSLESPNPQSQKEASNNAIKALSRKEETSNSEGGGGGDKDSDPEEQINLLRDEITSLQYYQACLCETFSKKAHVLQKAEDHPLKYLPKKGFESLKEIVNTARGFFWRSAGATFGISVSAIVLSASSFAIYSVYANLFTQVVTSSSGSIAGALGVICIAAMVLSLLSAVNMVKKNTNDETVCYLKQETTTNLSSHIKHHVRECLTKDRTKLTHLSVDAEKIEGNYRNSALKSNPVAQLAYNCAKHRRLASEGSQTASTKGMTETLMGYLQAYNPSIENADTTNTNEARIKGHTTQFIIYELTQIMLSVKHDEINPMIQGMLTPTVYAELCGKLNGYHHLAKAVVDHISQNPNAHNAFVAKLFTQIGGWYQTSEYTNTPSGFHFINNPSFFANITSPRDVAQGTLAAAATALSS